MFDDLLDVKVDGDGDFDDDNLLDCEMDFEVDDKGLDDFVNVFVIREWYFWASELIIDKMK